ncbi:MAG TPA: hypothetical protein VGE70_01060 [Burkholderiaceae bacterium]
MPGNLTLEPTRQISRRLTTPEYYHACIGESNRTIEPPREAIFVLTGEGHVAPETWRGALDAVAEANPGLRLRIVGSRMGTRWQSDGLTTPVRVVADPQWDGQSEEGSAFIYETRLNLHAGPATELIIAPQASGRTLVIFRALHAVMDGRGVRHFLYELFRALRGEPLLGTNVAFGDADLMKEVGPSHSTSRHVPSVALTGGQRGALQGDTWRRLTFPLPQHDILARTASAMAAYAHRHANGTALIAVPVDLRRHMPAIQSTLNFSSMLLVPMQPGDGPDVFKRGLRNMLEQKMEARYPRLLDWVRLLPLPWLDALVSRTPRNYVNKRLMETVLISNLGVFDLGTMHGAGFSTDNIFCLPLGGNACCVLAGTDRHVEMTVCLSQVLASDGRMDDLIRFLRESLSVNPDKSSA